MDTLHSRAKLHVFLQWALEIDTGSIVELNMQEIYAVHWKWTHYIVELKVHVFLHSALKMDTLHTRVEYAWSLYWAQKRTHHILELKVHVFLQWALKMDTLTVELNMHVFLYIGHKFWTHYIVELKVHVFLHCALKMDTLYSRADYARNFT